MHNEYLLPKTIIEFKKSSQCHVNHQRDWNYLCIRGPDP